MAIFYATAFTPLPFDMRALDFGALLGLRATTPPTSIHISLDGDGAGNHDYILAGSGLKSVFSGGELRDVTAGEIDSIFSLIDGTLGALSLHFSNLNLPAAQFFNLLQANKDGAALNLMLRGDDFVYGTDANDVLLGQNGNDRLRSFAGEDALYGGAGNDTLFGGTAADKFYFNTALNSTRNVDKLRDFDVTQDEIRLDNDVFKNIGPLGTLDDLRIAQGTSAQDAGDRIIYQSSTGKIWYDPDGTGAAAKVLFAIVPVNSAVSYDLFHIVD